jgi:hypothetical protein
LNEEVETNDQLDSRWAISIDWFDENNRSATMMIKEYLCEKCAEESRSKKKAESPQDMINRVHKCCGNSPEFINHRIPITESIFRLFLTNGNTPLSVTEISQQLSQLREGDSYRTSPEVLLHLLQNDEYYGLQEITD